jgi:hypothetical protein
MLDLHIYITYSNFILMTSSAEVITPKQLSKKLVEKHNRLLTEHTKEFDLLHELFVLSEKQDQLEHWIDDAMNDDDEKKCKAYKKQKEKSEKDILRTTKELEKLKTQDGYDPKQRYNSLKNIIDSHREAINYWSNFSE